MKENLKAKGCSVAGQNNKFDENTPNSQSYLNCIMSESKQDCICE